MLFDTLAVDEPTTPASHAMHETKHAHHGTPSYPIVRFCQSEGCGFPLFESGGDSLTPMKLFACDTHHERPPSSSGEYASPYLLCVSSHSSYTAPWCVAMQRLSYRAWRSLLPLFSASSAMRCQRLLRRATSQSTFACLRAFCSSVVDPNTK